MQIAVVIVTHRGGELLERCVAALGRQLLQPGRVRVVVSSAAPVRVPAAPPGAPWRVEAMYQGCNVGFAPSANLGMRGVEGPLLLLNDDTEADPALLSSLAAAVARDGAGIYQPCILLHQGEGRLDNAGHHLFPDGFNLCAGRGRALVPSAGPVGSFSGAAVLFTPEVLADVGLFDEDLDAFGEDVDLALRAVRRGYQIRVVPEARITHVLGASYGRISPRKIFLVERNRARLAARSLPLSALLVTPVTTPLRLGALGVAALLGRGPAASGGVQGAVATLAGALAGLRALPDALQKRRADAHRWRLGERAMLGHLWRHRVRLVDLGGRA